MIKTKPIYSYIVRNVMNSFNYKNLKNAVKKPIRKDEKILTSFILEWLSARYRIIEECFDVAYNKNWLPNYNVVKDKKCSNFLGIFLSSYKEASNLVLSNNLYNSAKNKQRQIESTANFTFTESFTEDEYKYVLYAFYCLYFYNTDLVIKYKTDKIFKWIKILKVIVENDDMYKYRERYLHDMKKEKYGKTVRLNYHTQNRTYKDYVMLNVTEDFFPETNIGQEYSYWKTYSEADSDSLKKSMLYSLYIRIPQKGTIASTPNGFLIAKLLYYWYYGIVEEHYAETLFDIVHGEYGDGEKQLIVRMFTEKSISDKNMLNYFKKKYAQYCNKRNISQNEQISILKSLNDNDGQSVQPASPKVPLQLSKMPDGFTTNQLQYLAKLLYGEHDGITLLATIDSKNALPYFLGVPNPKPASDYKISWKAGLKSLKYFITRLYDTKKMRGIWPKTRDVFLINQNKEIKGPESLSSISSTGKQGYLNIDNETKDFIDQCITEAKTVK